MNFGISGKKALVTAASRGLGRSIAQSLANEGVQVAVTSRNRAELDSFLKENSGSHYAIDLDLSATDGPKKLVDNMLKDFGAPDIIVHNMGGTMDVNDPFCSIEDWRKIYRFNLEVAIELNIAFVPLMQKRKWGRVVHISSISALENQGPPAYCAIKAALTAYTRSLGRYVSADGVSVSAVLPGAVFTEGGYWDTAVKNRPEHVDKYLKERMAIQRFGTPNEIGDVVAFLCSQQSSFIVGSSILVDGGQGRCFQREGE
ncbi:MAG: SDR family oxidoreductase [Bdellovibrionaceae bacterium]|nr:SDR family oxidoreductase [Bdellovibrio sp.]